MAYVRNSLLRHEWECDSIRSLPTHDIGGKVDQDFITPAEVSAITGLSIAALAQIRFRGTGVRFYKPTPRVVLYKRSEVIAWIEAGVQTQTGQPRARAHA